MSTENKKNNLKRAEKNNSKKVFIKYSWYAESTAACRGAFAFNEVCFIKSLFFTTFYNTILAQKNRTFGTTLKNMFFVP